MKPIQLGSCSALASISFFSTDELEKKLEMRRRAMESLRLQALKLYIAVPASWLSVEEQQLLRYLKIQNNQVIHA